MQGGHHRDARTGRPVWRSTPRPVAVLAVVAALLAIAGALLLWGGRAPSGGGVLYVANLRSSDVSVVTIDDQRETARIPVAENPHEFALTAAGLLVTNYHRAAVTRLPAGGRQPVMLPVAGTPHGIAVVGDLAVVTQGRLGRVAVLNVATGEVLAEIETGGEPHMVAATRTIAYVVDAASDQLIEIDPVAARVGRRVALGRLPESVSISPDGRTIAVANARSGDVSLVDAERFVERGRHEVPGAPVRVAFHPDGGTIAVSLNDTGEVALLDSRSGAVRAVLPAGQRPDGLAFSRDGRLLYVALSGERRLAVLDLKRGAVASHIDVGDGPSGLLLSR